MKCVELFLLLLLLSRGVEPRGWKNRSMYVGYFSKKEVPFCRVAMVSAGGGGGGRIWLVVMVATYRGRRREGVSG